MRGFFQTESLCHFLPIRAAVWRRHGLPVLELAPFARRSRPSQGCEPAAMPHSGDIRAEATGVIRPRPVIDVTPGPAQPPPAWHGRIRDPHTLLKLNPRGEGRRELGQHASLRSSAPRDPNRCRRARTGRVRASVLGAQPLADARPGVRGTGEPMDQHDGIGPRLSPFEIAKP